MAGRLVVLGFLALVAAGASAAWACVPQPMVLVQPQASARPGARVTVRGLNFNRPAEIRFNGLDGPRLATASGERFSVKVRIPKAASGLYTLVALTRDQGGGVSGVASAPLQVVSLGGSAKRGSSPPAGTAPPGRAGASSTSTPARVSPELAAAGGFGLLVLGGLAGALLVRRRERQSS